jgi:hypothetical protein
MIDKKILTAGRRGGPRRKSLVYSGLREIKKMPGPLPNTPKNREPGSWRKSTKAQARSPLSKNRLQPFGPFEDP